MRGVEVRLKQLPLQVREEGNWYIVNPEAGQKVRRSRQQDAGHEGRPGDQPGTPRGGQEPEGRPAPRVRTEADLPVPRLEPFPDCLEMLGQEEEEETPGNSTGKALEGLRRKLEEEKNQEERHTLELRKKIQEREKSFSEGSGGVDRPTHMELLVQHEGYRRERKGVVLGLEAAIDLVELAEEEQDH